MEAGCKKKEWETKNDTFQYHWIEDGTLLETGICIGPDYKKNFAPSETEPKVYSTIVYQRVRDVDPKAQTVSIDFTLVMRWIDPRIKANFLQQNRKHGGILISRETIQQLWIPDFQVWNRTTLKIEKEWASLISSKLLNSKEINDLDGKNRSEYEYSYPTVEMKYEIKTTVYCTFNYTKYPMDTQICDVGLGSASFESIFVLHDAKQIHHTQKQYQTGDLDILVEFFDAKQNDGENIVGMKIHMKRLTYSYFLRYYVPCGIVVAVSVVGFAIPIAEIAGRVDLLVTQLLTIISLFIAQMVSHKNYQISIEVRCILK